MTLDDIAAELKKIHDSVPDEYRRQAVIEVPATPTMKMVMEKAVHMESIPKEKRDQIQNLIDAGEFDKVRSIENQKITKIIDAHVTREITKAIKAGRLPSRKKLRTMTDVKELYERVHNQGS
jgi:hypothetical protein